VFSPAAGAQTNALVFPYMRDGELVNIKYRGSDKSFWQIKGAEKIMFGLDDIVGAREIVIVEGEMDKLALEQAGIKNVVSVPDGAPGKVRRRATYPRPRRTGSLNTSGTAGRRWTR
jgi:twinkle protein